MIPLSDKDVPADPGNDFAHHQIRRVFRAFLRSLYGTYFDGFFGCHDSWVSYQALAAPGAR